MCTHTLCMCTHFVLMLALYVMYYIQIEEEAKRNRNSIMSVLPCVGLLTSSLTGVCYKIGLRGPDIVSMLLMSSMSSPSIWLGSLYTPSVVAVMLHLCILIDCIYTNVHV